MNRENDYPQEAEKLLKEVSARIKIKDIKELYQLRDQVVFKWWETLILLLLFGAGLGFIVTAFFLVPEKNTDIFFNFLTFWVVLLTLTLIATIEFLILKFRALRRLHTLHSRWIEETQKDLKQLKQLLSQYQIKGEHPAVNSQ